MRRNVEDLEEVRNFSNFGLKWSEIVTKDEDDLRSGVPEEKHVLSTHVKVEGVAVHCLQFGIMKI